ncbi:unnamed protein product [Cylicocyclus nassatus]|uniref:Uncharacterized protein n=1 Tax=Cylicocyclus nassatus TaxID=53992 RepID=A0AA36GUI9_CYLNA|nr:unnamed protein product [Cylicocyclus nassatus]
MAELNVTDAQRRQKLAEENDTNEIQQRMGTIKNIVVDCGIPDVLNASSTTMPPNLSTPKRRRERKSSSKPFSVLSPNGERIPVVVKQPGGGTVARDETPSDTVRWDSPISLDPEDFELVHERKSKNATNVRQASASPINNHNDKVEWYSTEIENVEWYSKENQTLKQRRSRDVPIVPSDSVFSNALQQYGSFTDTRGILHRPRSRSPFTKPGLWEANPDNPHNRDHANKWYYAPRSVNVDWLIGQLAWGAHWAVPAASVGGTDGFSAVHFPTIGTFANIPDDYD